MSEDLFGDTTTNIPQETEGTTKKFKRGSKKEETYATAVKVAAYVLQHHVRTTQAYNKVEVPDGVSYAMVSKCILANKMLNKNTPVLAPAAAETSTMPKPKIEIAEASSTPTIAPPTPEPLRGLIPYIVDIPKYAKHPKIADAIATTLLEKLTAITGYPFTK